jgi:hypothetical protein
MAEKGEPWRRLGRDDGMAEKGEPRRRLCRVDGAVAVPSATLLHCCYIILRTINASYSPNTPTTCHHSVNADNDTSLVAVVAVTDADDATMHRLLWPMTM